MCCISQSIPPPALICIRQRVHLLLYCTLSFLHLPHLIEETDYSATMLDFLEPKASEIENIIDYVFSKKRLAAEAAQMAAPQIACIEDNTFRCLHNNKRLFILGESVLAKELCSTWFKKRGPQGRAPSPCSSRNALNALLTST
jgi:hypothetical protein